MGNVCKGRRSGGGDIPMSSVHGRGVVSCGSCGVIEESSPLRGRFVPPLIRDLENRRDVLSGQSTRGRGDGRAYYLLWLW